MTEYPMLPFDVRGADPTASHHRGNEQSRAAWDSMHTRDLATIREDVYRAIKTHQGLTCDEIEWILGLSHQTASARCTELLQRGFITRIGIRKTRSGRNAAVYGTTND